MPPSKPRDGREFVRVSVTLPDDPKLLDTSDVPRCLALYVVGLLYAREHRTDGVLRPETVVHDARVPKRLAGELVRVGLWHEPGHDCDRCEQPPAGRVIVHDYLEHNQSRDEIEAARALGKAAAEARWAGRKAAANGAKRNAERNAERIAVGNAEAEAEAEAEENPLLTYVSRLAGSNAKLGESLPAATIAAWRETAPEGVDLVAEARAYLAHYADRPATNERAAWLGWLRKAKPPKPVRVPCPDPSCSGGWLAPVDDRPRPCPSCRPHLRAVDAS